MTASTGIFDYPATDYHEDRHGSVPTLSASIAHLLCSSSPAHARAAHPRLNPDYQRIEEQKFDVGTAAHALILEGRNSVAVIDAADWRTNAAKEERDNARAQGRIPLLAHQYDEVVRMVSALGAQLLAHEAKPLVLGDPGKPEQTLMWEEDGVACRARVDWLHNDFRAVDDIKTTSRSAHPAQFSRNLYSIGADIQAAFYIRGVEAITGVTPEFRWAVVETTPPYALSVIAPDPAVLMVGRKKVDYALELWRKCLAEDHWPGYPTQVCFAELPAYEEARWLEKEMAA